MGFSIRGNGCLKPCGLLLGKVFKTEKGDDIEDAVITNTNEDAPRDIEFECSVDHVLAQKIMRELDDIHKEQ